VEPRPIETASLRAASYACAGLGGGGCEPRPAPDWRDAWASGPPVAVGTSQEDAGETPALGEADTRGQGGRAFDG